MARRGQAPLVLSTQRPDAGLGLFHIRERLDHVGGALSVLLSFDPQTTSAAPAGTLDLADGSDTGISHTDDLTRLDNATAEIPRRNRINSP